MDNPIDNPREELYRRFQESLSKPVSERFFDEDELVEIYDYAGDLKDDYVQLEALFCGVRLYPESRLLAERRALFYLDTTDDETSQRTEAAAKYLSDNPDFSSAIFDMARLEIAPSPNPEEGLQFILDQYTSFDDEEIIRFVGLACTLGCYTWLVKNIDRIGEKVPFKPAYYYEIAEEADTRDDSATLTRMADALIEIEPFTPHYWVLLLKGQLGLGDISQARQTLDYAKALANDNPQAAMSLAEVLYNKAPELLTELEDILKPLAEANKDDFIYVDCLSAIYMQTKRPDDAVAAIKAFVDTHPYHPHAMRQLIICNPPDIQTYLDFYFLTTGKEGAERLDEEDIISSLAMRGAFRTIDKFAMGYLREVGEMSDFMFSTWLEALFIIEKYDRVIEVASIGDHLETAMSNPYKGPAIAYMYCVALVKTGQHVQALEFAKARVPGFQAMMKGTPLALRMAVRTFFTLIDRLEQHGADEKLYWEYFDLLSVSKF